MAICFCNRAAAYQSLGQIIDAISDCSIAIALDENYSKVGYKIVVIIFRMLIILNLAFLYISTVDKNLDDGLNES